MPVSPSVIRNLVAIGKAYGHATGRRSLAKVAREVYGRASFFDDIRRKHQTVTLKNLDELLTRFQAKWPPGAPWPEMEPVSMAPGKDFPQEKR